MPGRRQFDGTVPTAGFRLNSNEVSPVAKNLGLYLLGELDDKAVSETEAEVAEWYISAAENEKRLSRVLFKSEFAEPRI